MPVISTNSQTLKQKCAEQSLVSHGIDRRSRQAVRLLVRSPVFTLTAIGLSGLGIGAAATIFSLTDALMFEPTVGVRNASEMYRYRKRQ